MEDSNLPDDSERVKIIFKKGIMPFSNSIDDYMFPSLAIERYRKTMGLRPSDADPTKDDLERLRAYERDSWLYYSTYGKTPLLSFKEKERQRLKQEFCDFQPFDTLEEIFKEWDCKGGKILEVKFIKPSTFAEWQSTIYRCATMVKILKTLNHFMQTSLHKYNFVYQCKALFKKTTHAFEYNAANFAFVIRTGLGSGGQEVKNLPVNFYEQTQQQLHYLLDEMKKELPQSHYEQAFMLYVLIKDKKRAIL
jgi:hypothetical protein